MGPRGVGARRVKPEGSRPEEWGPEGSGAQRVGARRREAQNFAFFFPRPPQFSLFLPSFGGLLVEFWWCLKRRDPQVCTFGRAVVRNPGGPEHFCGGQKTKIILTHGGRQRRLADGGMPVEDAHLSEAKCQLTFRRPNSS